MHKACSNCGSSGAGTRSGTSGFRITDGTPTHEGRDISRVHASRRADFKSPARRCSSAPLLLAIASLLTACGGGGGDSGIVCTTGPSPAVLVWDPVSDPDLGGYRVYYGTDPGTFLQPAGEGLDAAAATTYTVTDLDKGTTYYFAVKAYDTSVSAKEGAFSNEVCKTITTRSLPPGTASLRRSLPAR